MQALHIMRPAHFFTIILNCTTSIRISFLHFGQNSGKLTRTVSSYTLLRVLPPQEGQCIHLDFCCFFCKCTSPLSFLRSSAAQRLAFARFLLCVCLYSCGRFCQFSMELNSHQHCYYGRNHIRNGLCIEYPVYSP